MISDISIVRLECPEPAEYYNAYITTPEISRSFGSTLQYACPTGYAWVGGVVTCSTAGSWQSEGQIEGCLVLAPGSNCASDTTCSPVVSAKCKSDVCVCPAGFSYLPDTSACTRDCKSLFNSGVQSNGVYEITPDGINSVNTLCDMENGGWTVFERRFIGNVDFMLEWDAYRQFFGSLNGDFWLGLDYLHALTVADSDIYFDFTTSANQPFYARYHNFSVADNHTLFKISMSSVYEITPEYSNIRNGGFYDHNNMYFSTPQHDNDISATNCASTRGAWWWNKCYTFGMFLKSFNFMKMYMGYNDTYVYFKETTMKVRRTK
ncbi:Ficolin-1 [Mizuhopecten yessoensis]|uniref:Ficolin-1 n=1 Tax=Mizuhopecten yessoensis TaxID=6573 RepID=A0A210PEW6_MIZYE|nr:Ficolin-1 [Mizuhopecten yessoensis]